jgi:hypothetical protein
MWRSGGLSGRKTQGNFAPMGAYSHFFHLKYM